MVKNCDLGLENAPLGLRPRTVFSRPRSQFFTVRTSQPANNIYLFSRVIQAFQKSFGNGLFFTEISKVGLKCIGKL